jgi:hypothetical protein
MSDEQEYPKLTFSRFCLSLSIVFFLVAAAGGVMYLFLWSIESVVRMLF